MRHAFASGMIARGISSTALAALMGTSRARELADGLSVTLPVELARTQLRPLLNQTDLQRVRETLREEHTPTDAVWLKRRKEAHEKMAGGDPNGLAEVVRDGALRERRLRTKGNGSLLSAGEKALYMKARSSSLARSASRTGSSQLRQTHASTSSSTQQPRACRSSADRAKPGIERRRMRSSRGRRYDQ